MNREAFRRMLRTGLRSLLLVGVFCLAGCGGGSGSNVTGKVTFNGKPVVWGSVIMVDAKGEYHQGDIELDGSYKITGIPAGTVKIGVTSPNPEGRPRAGKDAGGVAKKANLDDPRENFLATQPKAAERPLPPAGAWFPLPPTAGDPMTSGLTGTVAGKPIDIDVK